MNLTEKNLIDVACIQMTCGDDTEINISKASKLIRDAATKGANIILMQELFQTLYFCQDQIGSNFKHAYSIEESTMLKTMQELAKELCVVLPISFFEKSNNSHFNSLAMIDADGTLMGVYRKSHIPDGPGYQEKFYFSPGDTGFKVWKTKYAAIGCGICWDQWFPEAARDMALQGAELLFYPTAIGSEPQDKTLDSKDHWKRVMQGHAAANLVPVIASNRIGIEKALTIESDITFYGNSFITDHTGAIMQQADAESESILIHSFDLKAIATARAEWGLFRDRRPSLYKRLLTLDGKM
jgi:N-carbamoylputrescine amidase